MIAEWRDTTEDQPMPGPATSKNPEARAIMDFIAKRGVTKCPPAATDLTTATIDPESRAIIAAHAAEQAEISSKPWKDRKNAVIARARLAEAERKKAEAGKEPLIRIPIVPPKPSIWTLHQARRQAGTSTPAASPRKAAKRAEQPTEATQVTTRRAIRAPQPNACKAAPQKAAMAAPPQPPMPVPRPAPAIPAWRILAGQKIAAVDLGDVVEAAPIVVPPKAPPADLPAEPVSLIAPTPLEPPATRPVEPVAPIAPEREDPPADPVAPVTVIIEDAQSEPAVPVATLPKVAGEPIAQPESDDLRMIVLEALHGLRTGLVSAQEASATAALVSCLIQLRTPAT